MTVFSRRGLSARVTDDLGRRIVSGRLTPGSVIDVEQLETDFDVSRTVVREALKVLTDKGLVDARPRTGTYVLPRQSWNLLDSDVMLWRAADGMSATLLRELDELRHMVEPWAARMAALHRTPEDLARMEAAVKDMVAAHERHLSSNADTLRSHVDADIAFHTAILRATGNELVGHMDAMLRPILEFRDALIPQGKQNAHFLEGHRAVYDAIEAGDGDSAYVAMETLLASAAADVDRVVKGRP